MVRECSAISTVEKARWAWVRREHKRTGVAWRLEKIREVELLDGLWHTAENHSRPAHCIERVEIDVDDQPERD